MLSLARKVLLPDLEFYINLGDWPLEHQKAHDILDLYLSFPGVTLDSRAVILPTCDITHSTLEAMRGVTNDLLSIQGNTEPSWISKTEKALSEVEIFVRRGCSWYSYSKKTHNC